MRADPNEGVRSFPKLTQEDLGTDDVVVFTVSGYEQRTMPDGGMVKELHFEEIGGVPLRLNKTQLGYLIDGIGSDDTDDWTGKQVPVEKITKQGPDGKDYKVVWVCAPESWAYIFREAGLPVPAYATKAVKVVQSAAPARKAAKGIKRGASGVKRGKR